jgi:hypothetical protein
VITLHLCNRNPRRFYDCLIEVPDSSIRRSYIYTCLHLESVVLFRVGNRFARDDFLRTSPANQSSLFVMDRFSTLRIELPCYLSSLFVQ